MKTIGIDLSSQSNIGQLWSVLGINVVLIGLASTVVPSASLNSWAHLELRNVRLFVVYHWHTWLLVLLIGVNVCLLHCPSSLMSWRMLTHDRLAYIKLLIIEVACAIDHF